MAVQATRQEIVRVLRKTGFTEVAESPSVSLFQPVCGGGWLRWGSVSGREEAPGRRVHDQDLLSDRELPRACLPVRRRCVHLDPALPARLLANPADGQPVPSVRMCSTPIAATTMTNTAGKFARLGSLQPRFLITAMSSQGNP